jgi:hypothetical protein
VGETARQDTTEAARREVLKAVELDGLLNKNEERFKNEKWRLKAKACIQENNASVPSAEWP